MKGAIASRWVSLFVVLVLSKSIVLGLRLSDHALVLTTLPWRAWLALPLVLCREDLLFVLSMYAAEKLLQGFLPTGRAFAFLYAVTSLYAASNLPVMRMFGTPLTFQIANAAGLALVDSLRLYVTRGNVLGIAAVLLCAWLLPTLLSRIAKRVRATWLQLQRAAWLALLLLLLLLVPMSLRGSTAALDLSGFAGLGRNAWFTLLWTTYLQIHGPAVQRSARLASVEPLPPLPALPSDQSGPPSPDLRPLQGAAQGRDVLWIVLESTGARALPAYATAADSARSSGPDPMPALSRFVRGGLAFDAIYAAYPESIKGLYATLCSSAPAVHTTAARYTQAQRPCRSIGQRLADVGYHTAMFHSGWFAYLGMQGIVDGRGFSVLKDAGDIGGQYRTSFGVDERSTVQHVLQFFDAVPHDQRAFVMYLPITGHHPYHSPGPKPGAQPGRPQPFGIDSELAHYRNDLRLGDDALAELFSGLAARGRLSRLLVVISGDHGEAFQQHPGNFGHTLHLYEENIHVPLFVVLPTVTDDAAWRSRTGLSRVAQPGSVMDIGPTLLDLLGLPADAATDEARSLLRAGSQDGAIATHADVVPHFMTDHALVQLGLRHGVWKFIDEPDSQRARLFDVVADPDETIDRSAQHPDQVAQYRAHLRAWAQRTRALVR